MSDDERSPDDGFDPDRAPETGPTEDERLLDSALPPDVERRQRGMSKDSWRVFRIMGEFVEGFDELSDLGPAVSFFGSARASAADPMYQRCVETARRFGEAGFSIITGGGPGMMEAANKGAREAGVRSVGCNIELPFEQGSNRYVDTPIDFRYFFVRKTMFVKYAQAFVCFPGGFGTMDELFESLTLIQTQKVRHFPVILFGNDYWSGLIDWIKGTLLEEGKISAKDVDLLMCTDSPEQAVSFVHKHFREAQREDPEEVRSEDTRPEENP